MSSVSLLGCDLPLARRQLDAAAPARGRATRHRSPRQATRRAGRALLPLVGARPGAAADRRAPRRSARLRHYRNLAPHAASGCGTISGGTTCRRRREWLDVGGGPAAGAARRRDGRASSPTRRDRRRRSFRRRAACRAWPCRVVIPCFNEERALPYLANTLQRLEDVARRGVRSPLHRSWTTAAPTTRRAVLRTLFADWAERHRAAPRAATAARPRPSRPARSRRRRRSCARWTATARYDPHELARMIPRLRSGVDLVVASPYHPDGAARDVPRVATRAVDGRSRAATARVLRQPLHDYTSSFRVYRRSRLLALRVRRAGFIGAHGDPRAARSRGRDDRRASGDARRADLRPLPTPTSCAASPAISDCSPSWRGGACAAGDARRSRSDSRRRRPRSMRDGIDRPDRTHRLTR